MDAPIHSMTTLAEFHESFAKMLDTYPSVRAVERPTRDLQRTPRTRTGSGAPTQPARDGTHYVDTTSGKHWLRMSGVWKSSAAYT